MTEQNDNQDVRCVGRDDCEGPSRFYRTAAPDIYSILKSFSLNNRKESTLYEDILWQELRKKQCGAYFRRQHAIGDYIVDFVCLPLHLIIEVDGGYHHQPQQEQEDKLRTQWLEHMGYTVLRFTNEEVAYNTNQVIQTIKKEVLNLQK